MKTIIAFALLAGAAASVTGCSGGRQRGPSNAVIERALTGAPGAAQPSSIVSVELAYAREARERGLAAAGSDYAASGALLHADTGPVRWTSAAQALRGADAATQWGPRVVVKSCDGALALSQGRFVDADGLVGNYVTTWVRQNDGSYKWSYDVAGHDDPQPPPRAEFEDGDIVVTALDMVRGLVATCPRADEIIPPPPPIPVGEEGSADAQLSRDGTLRWRWEHREDGTRYVHAEYFFEGEWVTAIEESLASAPEG